MPKIRENMENLTSKFDNRDVEGDETRQTLHFP
jgi:hypothetical protein